jgi:hypothetical protein
MAEQYANNAQTTLNGAINNSTTSITVTDGSVFPSSGDFRLKCESELMLCTARSGNTLTVTRGIESTTAASHADLTQISLVLTKQSFLNLMTEASLKGARASRPSSAQTGAWYYPTDYGMPSRYNGSSWDAFNPHICRFVTPPVVSDYSWVNQDSSTASDRDGILFGTPYSGSDSVKMLTKSLPATTYDLKASFRSSARSKDYSGCGIALRESSSGKVITYLLKNDTGKLAIDKWNSPSSYNALVYGTFPPFQTSGDWHLRIVRGATNRTYYWSVNGYDWLQFYQLANDYITENQFALTFHTFWNGISGTQQCGQAWFYNIEVS